MVVGADALVFARIKSVLKEFAWECVEMGGIQAADLKKNAASNSDVIIVVQPPDEIPDRELIGLRSQTTAKLVVLGVADSKRILDLLRNCGVDEFLDQADLEKEVESFIRRSKRQTHGKVIAVLSPSAGGGSTTVAANFATAVAKGGAQCVLIDLNLSTGDLAALLDVKPQRSISDLARNLTRMDEEMFAQMLTFDRNGVGLLSAPLDLEEIPTINRSAVYSAISASREKFAFVVVDVNSSLNSEQIAALELADAIIIVFQLDFCSLKNVGRVLEYLWKHGVGKSSVTLVANRHGQSCELTKSQVESALDMKIEAFLPDDRKRVIGSANTGVPFVIGSPRAAISQQIEKLVQGLKM